MQTKKIKAGLIILLALILSIMPMAAQAAEGTHEGIKAVLTLDKKDYAIEDPVQAKIEISNLREYAVQNLRAVLTLPEGMRLQDGQQGTILIRELAAGETKTQTVEAIALADESDDENENGDNDDNGGSVPKTGQTETLLIWIGISLGAIVGFFYLLRKNKKMQMQFMSILLCLAMILSGVQLARPAYAKIDNMDFSVTEKVTVNGEADEVTLEIFFDVKTLTGEAKIVGTFAFGEELSIDISGLEDADEEKLLYQWLRDGEPIVDATERTYTVTQEDIGAVLGCIVTSGATDGMTTATAKVTTEKAIQEKPVIGEEGSGADAEVYGGVQEITIVNNHETLELQYSIDSGDTWEALPAGEEITIPVTHGMYDVLLYYPETDTHEESEEISVEVEATYPVLGGEATLVGTPAFGETLSIDIENITGAIPETFSYEWQRDGVTIDGETAASYTLVKKDIGAAISCIVTSNAASASITATTDSTIEKAEQDTPTYGTSGSGMNVEVYGGPVQVTLKNNKTGYTLKYSVDGGAEKSLSAGNTINETVSVGAHTVTFYYEETDTHEASPEASTTVTATNPVLGGSATIAGTLKYGQRLTVNAESVTGAPANTFSYQWKRGGTGGTNIGTGTNYTLVQADIGATITCVITSSAADGSVSRTTGTVGKADQAAPTDDVITTLGVRNREIRIVNRKVNTDQTSITIQYSIDSSSNWQGPITISGATANNYHDVTGVNSGSHTVYYRYPETDIYNASPVYSNTVTVP
ncbi:MAG: LPXTG cell wall anchor domain-containing protein [Christensenellaceae bacterium]|jgi:LPXTG-motif cell wall-anchored protein